MTEQNRNLTTMVQQSLTISNYRTTDSKSMLNFD